MGRNKKQKTKYLSQAEIWDDSALTRSWDEAVAEYEYYHSLHVSGEDIEAVLDAAEAKENGSMAINDKTESNEASGVDEELEDGELDAEDAVELKVEDGEIEENQVPPNGPIGEQAHQVADGAEGVDDQSSKHSPEQLLENIKMAYWWAGYYSGLYEAQQQSTTQKP